MKQLYDGYSFPPHTETQETPENMAAGLPSCIWEWGPNNILELGRHAWECSVQDNLRECNFERMKAGFSDIYWKWNSLAEKSSYPFCKHCVTSSEEGSSPNHTKLVQINLSICSFFNVYGWADNIVSRKHMSSSIWDSHFKVIKREINGATARMQLLVHPCVDLRQVPRNRTDTLWISSSLPAGFYTISLMQT